MRRSSCWRSTVRPRAGAPTRAGRSGRATCATASREEVQLDAALALAGPDVGQRAAELGVPQQRRQVVDRDDHADVVDGAVRHGPDRDVGERAAAEQPDVAGRRGGDGVVERQGPRAVHGAYRTGRCASPGSSSASPGVAGVAATGVVVARRRRAHREYDPVELRDRLHRRLAEAAPAAGAAAGPPVPGARRPAGRPGLDYDVGARGTLSRSRPRGAPDRTQRERCEPPPPDRGCSPSCSRSRASSRWPPTAARAPRRRPPPASPRASPTCCPPPRRPAPTTSPAGRAPPTPRRSCSSTARSRARPTTG